MRNHDERLVRMPKHGAAVSGRIVRRMLARCGSSEGHAGILYEAGHAASMRPGRVRAQTLAGPSSSDAAGSARFGHAVAETHRPARCAGDRLALTPGWRLVTVSSFVVGSGSMMQRSVIILDRALRS